MSKNSNEKLWWFPGHDKWIRVRVNSQSKKYTIRDLTVLLQKFGLLKKFKQGSFGQYLNLKQPVTVYGHKIHNILKREIIHPSEQKPDEMWFGLGKLKAYFAQEEF